MSLSPLLLPPFHWEWWNRWDVVSIDLPWLEGVASGPDGGGGGRLCLLLLVSMSLAWMTVLKGGVGEQPEEGTPRYET